MAGLAEAVKSLVVRFTSENYEPVKAEIDSIPDEKTVKVGYDSSALSAGITDLATKIESDLGGGSDGKGGLLGNLIAKLLGGAGGAIGAIPGLGGVGGAIAGSNPYVGAAALAAAVAGVGALSVEVLGVVSGLAAAAQGVFAFGALAYPTFTTISGAVTQIGTDTAAYQAATTTAAKQTDLAKIKADWAALDPVQKTAVQNVMSLQTQFDNLATKFEPLLAPLINTLTGKGGIISQILQDLPPFADAAAKAIGPLLTEFNNFLKSPGAQQFQNTMVQIEKLAIPAIGQGIGRVAVAVGQLLTTLSSKDDANAIKLAFDIIVWSIEAIRGAILLVTKSWDFMVNVFLGSVSIIVNGAAKAFGWIPGLGPMLQKSADAFNTWEHHILGGLGTIQTNAGITAQAVAAVGFAAINAFNQAALLKGLPPPGPRPGANSGAAVGAASYAGSAGAATVNNHLTVNAGVIAGGESQFRTFLKASIRAHGGNPNIIGA